MSNVVLVVDMVVGFMEPGHNLYCGDDARQIIPRVQQLIEREQAAGAEVTPSASVYSSATPTTRTIWSSKCSPSTASEGRRKQR